ncbi:hypothetical protein [Streptomyces sp. NPDC053367]|uniref:hypothetical protein n=1 Tax=Streptomyces sp. NPDC053367 TaxID=3365700 RepID=UPI0037D04E68
MTHFPSKRLPRRGVVPAAVAGLVATPGLGAAGESHARAIHDSCYDGLRHSHQGDATAESVWRGSIPRRTTGRHDTGSAAFEPREFSAYRLDPAAVPALVRRFPGGFREKVRFPVTKQNIVLQGTGQERSDTAIVYGTPAEYGGSDGSATVRIAASDVTARLPTFGNDLDEAAHEVHGEQAPAVQRTGDRIVLYDTAFPGGQDTPMTDSPRPTTVGRVHIRGSSAEGDIGLLRDPDAVVTADRPRTSDGDAASYGVDDRLRGADDRAPYTH